MKNEEILKKAIDKAVKNGYPDWGVPKSFAVYSVIFSHGFAKAFWGVEKLRVNQCPKCGWSKPYSKHDEELYCPVDGRKLKEGEETPFSQHWKLCLQQMVLEEDPIKYLEQFI